MTMDSRGNLVGRVPSLGVPMAFSNRILVLPLAIPRRDRAGRRTARGGHAGEWPGATDTDGQARFPRRHRDFNCVVQLDQRRPHGRRHKPERRGGVSGAGRDQRRATLLSRGLEVSIKRAIQQEETEGTESQIFVRDSATEDRHSPDVKIWQRLLLTRSSVSVFSVISCSIQLFLFAQRVVTPSSPTLQRAAVLIVLLEAGRRVTIALDGCHGCIGPFARTRTRVYGHALERRAGCA
jgi:hypothetical protein